VNIKRIKEYPHYEKAKYWGKLISITGAAQVVVQAVSFISGILVIRLLPVEEYALYTLANAMLGTMSLLSDGGISTGVMAQGGKVWQDKQKLGAVLATGLDLRRKFAGFSLIVSIPILSYLLLHHGASWITTVLITISLIPAFYAALSDTLLQIPVKLHQAIAPLQRNQVEVGIGRLALTGFTLFAFPWAFVAIIASGIPRIWGNWKLRRIVDRFVDREQQPDIDERREILKTIKRILPMLIYISFSGQITIWLMSIFGKTLAVAQLGALGRISVVLTIFYVLIGTLIIPRFARLEKNKSIVFKRYIQILISIIILMLSIIGITHLFSNQILWIFGKNYSTLQYELLLSIICSCLSTMTGVIYALCTSKGWILLPVVSVLSGLVPLIIGCFIFNISTLLGVLYLNIFCSVISLLFCVSFGFCKIYAL
jgi:O-antigen/teichoic acid export membrane protein